MPPMRCRCSLDSVYVWLVLACFADQVSLCIAAKGLASHGEAQAEWALRDALSSWPQQEGLAPRNLTQIQGKLEVSFNALPSLAEGRVGTRAARHLLQEYFITEFGWIIAGLEPHMMKRKVVKGLHEVPVLRREMPKVSEIMQAANLSLHGVGLELLTVYAALVEMLVVHQLVYVLRAAYAYNDLSMTQSVDKKQVREIMLSCLAMMRTLPAILLDHPAGAPLRQDQMDYYARMMTSIKGHDQQWNRLVSFTKQVWTHAIKAGVVLKNQSYSYADVKKLYVRLVEQFGHMEDISCHEMKRDLRALDPYQTGRVALKHFYSSSAGSPYSFGESSKWLNRYGILDTTNRQMPSVMVSGYIEGVCNCVMSHTYVQVCCIPECPMIQRQIEAILQAPTASPEELLQIVTHNVTTGNETLPRTVPPKLIKLLSTIVNANGQINIHGRLFAQWLHYLEPYKCAYPVPIKSATIFKFKGDSSMARKDEAKKWVESDYDVHAVYHHMELPAITLWGTDEVLPLQEGDRRLASNESLDEQMPGSWKFYVALAVLLFGMQRWASVFYSMHRKRLEAELLRESDRGLESKKGKGAKVRKGETRCQSASDAAQDTDASQDAPTVVKEGFSSKPQKPSPKASTAASPKVPHKGSPKPPKAVPSLQSTPQPANKLPTLAECDADATDTLQEPFSATLGTVTVCSKKDDGENISGDANLEEVKRTAGAKKEGQDMQGPEKDVLKPASSLKPPQPSSKASPAASPKLPHKVSPTPQKAAPSMQSSPQPLNKFPTKPPRPSPKASPAASPKIPPYKPSPTPPKATPSMQSTPQPANKLPTLTECDADATGTLQEPFSATLETAAASAKKGDDVKKISANAKTEEVKLTDEAEKGKQQIQVAREDRTDKKMTSEGAKAKAEQLTKAGHTKSIEESRSTEVENGRITEKKQTEETRKKTEEAKKTHGTKIAEGAKRVEPPKKTMSDAPREGFSATKSPKVVKPPPKASPAPSPNAPQKASPKPPKAAPSLQSDTPQPLKKLPTPTECDAEAMDTLQEPFSATLETAAVSVKKEGDVQKISANANPDAPREPFASVFATVAGDAPGHDERKSILANADNREGKQIDEAKKNRKTVNRELVSGENDEAKVNTPDLATMEQAAKVEDATSSGAETKRASETKKMEEATKKTTEATCKRTADTMNAEDISKVKESAKTYESVQQTETVGRSGEHVHDVKKEAQTTKVAKADIKAEGAGHKAREELKRAEEVRGKAEEELRKAGEARKRVEEELKAAAEARKKTEESVKADQIRKVEEARKLAGKQQLADEAKRVQESREEAERIREQATEELRDALKKAEETKAREEAEQIEAARKQATEELRKAEEARALAEAELQKAADIRKMVEEELRKAEEVRKLEEARSSDAKTKQKEASEAEAKESSALQWLNQDLGDSPTEWLEGSTEEQECVEASSDRTNKVHSSALTLGSSNALLQAWAAAPPPGFGDVPLGPPPGLAPPPGLEMFGPDPVDSIYQ